MAASPSFLIQYLPILMFIGIAVVLGGAMMLAAFVVAPSKPDAGKALGL